MEVSWCQYQQSKLCWKYYEQEIKKGVLVGGRMCVVGWDGDGVKNSILFHEFYRNNKIKISDQRGHYKDQDEGGY